MILLRQASCKIAKKRRQAPIPFFFASATLVSYAQATMGHCPWPRGPPLSSHPRPVLTPGTQQYCGSSSLAMLSMKVMIETTFIRFERQIVW